MSITQIIHRVGLALGGIAVLLGVALFFTEGLAESVPINLAAAQFTAFMAILLTLWIARTRYNASPTETAVPDVEYPLSTKAPGDDLDELVYRLTRLGEGRIEYREQIFERVKEIAAAVIVERHGVSRAEAMGMLEDGSWTESDLAASFFGAPGRSVGSPSLFDQVKSRFTDQDFQYEQQLDATVAAIESMADFSDRSSAGDDDEPKGAMAPVGIDTEDAMEWISETVQYGSPLTTHQWTGVSAFALAALAVGIIVSQPAILLASAVGIAVAGYARAGSPPALSTLDVTRTLSEKEPEPGEEVTVTVTVENTGESFLADLRLIDRVPSMMRVVDGSPRLGTALRPGQTATFTYTVQAERGEHTWPLQVVGRDFSGSVEREARIHPDTELSCVPRLRTTAEAPVRLQTSIYSGEVETRTGGGGLEFYSIRDYQPGDPKRRIDWKNYAKTGEFTTIDFREERAARIVLLFDARSGSYVSSAPGEKHALDKSVDAAFDIFASLNDQGHLIGIAAFNGIPCWLGPSTGTLHLQRVRQLFVEHPALTPLPPELADKDEGRYVDPMIHIRRQLPGNTQIFLFSPLTDHYTYEVARRLNGAGHLVTIISPDPTTDRTVGQRLANLERSVRVKLLRDHGIRVVDWNTDESLPLALEYAQRRWQ